MCILYLVGVYVTAYKRRFFGLCSYSIAWRLANIQYIVRCQDDVLDTYHDSNHNWIPQAHPDPGGRLLQFRLEREHHVRIYEPTALTG